jgi:hypothetical protein
MIKKISFYNKWNDEFFMYDMSRFTFMFKENMPNWKIDKWLYND